VKWAPFQVEALRRAAHHASLAAIVRLEAADTRRVASQEDIDDETRAWVLEATETVDQVAEEYQQTSESYLALFAEAGSVDEDHDADGFA
jgi:hypothetical protein